MFNPLVLGEGSWVELFRDPSSLGVVVGPLMVVLIVVVTTGAYYWYKVAKVRAEAELKQTMIERGMSAADIERVLAAKTPEK
jgi:hypothetical protein